MSEVTNGWCGACRAGAPAPSDETEAVEALAEVLRPWAFARVAEFVGPSTLEVREKSRQQARAVLASDWYRDTIAAAEARGARAVSERVEALTPPENDGTWSPEAWAIYKHGWLACHGLRLAALNDGGGR